ncbi:hypothetical protein ND861_09495 [Leptospira sp. 2 VSF19]|uniref:Uncharacterized protein n=2 Tax=Leptospira soteropolitanensis TaxID=2950025 RepID=A0AAW5VHL7_9LEPT|nr:hypothetical protein [Leptospira soteropolitanensis]MCW7500609.1 hypothetical protein [Leptospira soteropolitanensis]MCW7522721.1 hypothetical protein [Leptospira soteropolitanensis]MCW7526577.1 hypothetical protein [Leptospira soteropolitanensis]MCW7530579.1 hypothetical protein [Leptospira soteropolitanensis]
MKAGEYLTKFESMDTRKRPDSSEVYQIFVDFASLIVSLKEDDLEQIKKQVNLNLAKKLLSISGYLSEYSMFTNSKQCLHAALICHCIEDTFIDYRENIRYLVLIEFAAKKINVDFFNLVKSILPYCSVRTKENLENYINRDGSLNELKNFQIKFKMVEGYPTFLPE